MPLIVVIDQSVDTEDALGFIKEIEDLRMTRNQGADISYGELAGDIQVSVTLTVPGTYDEFPEIVREIAVRHKICPDCVEVTVHPDPDGFE